MLVSVLGGLVVLALLVVNVAVLVDGPSRSERMRTPNEVGVTPGQYHDAWGATLDADTAMIRFEAAASSYLGALPVDDGTAVINGADFLAQLDRAAADLAASPARKDPGFEELHTTWSQALEDYRASRERFLEASEAAAPVLETCNPYALPVHTARDRANAGLLRGCSRDLAALGETGDPVLDAILTDARPHLDEWAEAVEGDQQQADAARDAYIAAFTDGEVRGGAELEQSAAPVEAAREALAGYAEQHGRP